MTASLAPQPASLTLSAWWQWWEIELRARGVRPATVVYQRKTLGKLVRFTGDVEPVRVTGEVLEAWRDHMRDVESLRPSTVNGYLSALRTFLRWLAAEGELSEAPRLPARLRETPAAMRPVDVYDEGALAKLHAGTQANVRGRSTFEAVRDAALVSLLQDTGIRASECAGLLVEHLDLPARQALVHSEIAKAGYSRTVCFGFQTARALAKYLRLRAAHDFAWCPQVFLGRRGPATYFLVAGAVRKAGRRSGVEGARAHRFRHTWAHDLKRQGVDSEVLMSLGGWRSMTMVARYGRAERDTRAVEAYQRIGSPVDRQRLADGRG